jgi:16S rRNA (guanine527-N7)-methyltransferase
MLTSSEIKTLLIPYGFEACTEVAEKIGGYVELLLKWNQKIALTTVTNPVEIVKFHFGESLFAISTGACGKSRLADVGTGPGFPGLALALADSSLQVSLIESNLKKCAFLAEIIRRLEIPNAIVLPKRMESLDSNVSGFHWVAARALGQFDKLLPWASKHLSPTGRVILWLGDSDARKISREPDWEWEAPVLIPGSERRFILMGSSKTSAR